MADIEIDDREMRQFAADLARIPGRFKPLVKDALTKTAADIVGSAKKAAPVDTGNLRASISADPVEEVNDGTFATEVGPTAAYGIFLEMGTSRMAPRPFLFPAAEEHSEMLNKALSRLVDGAL